MKKLEGYMKGVNLGGWLSQYNDTTKEYYDTFIVEDDIDRIKNAGFDHVRIPVDYDILEDEAGNPKEGGYMYLDKCISWCKEKGLNVILDLHKTFGYSFDPLEKDQDKEIFFHDVAMQERFYSLWDRISKRYGKISIVAFELLNEIVPFGVSKEWNAIAHKAAIIVRANAPEAYIIIGGVCYNSIIAVPLLDPPMDDRIVYNFHCYEPLIFTHQRAYWVNNMPDDLVVDYPGDIQDYKEKSACLDPDLAAAINRGEITGMGAEYFDKLFVPAIEAAIKNDVPLYCGEYGVIELAPEDAAKRWFDDIHSIFDKYGIGHAVWNYKEKDFGSMVQRLFF